MTEKERAEMQSIRNWLEQNALCGAFNEWQQSSQNYSNASPQEQYRAFKRLIEEKGGV